MGSYFKPLRRKIGVATLVMGCAFAAGWIRSQGSTDVLEVRGIDHRLHFLISGNNWIGWAMHHTFPEQIHTFWFVWGHSTDPDTPFTMAHKRWDGNSFRSDESIQNLHLITPYAAIVIPLTLLSAWLLLSKPGVKPKTSTPPSH